MCHRSFGRESARDRLNNRLGQRQGVLAPNKGVPLDSEDELDEVADMMEQDVTLKKKTQKHKKKHTRKTHHHKKRTTHHHQPDQTDTDGESLGNTGGQSLESSEGLERDLTQVRLQMDHEVQQMRGIMGLVGNLRTNDKRDNSKENNLNEP